MSSGDPSFDDTTDGASGDAWDQTERLYQPENELAAEEATEGEDPVQSEVPVDPELEDLFASLKPEEKGESIGPFKLLELLGEGAFGSVWMAEQSVPVRRRVALKILKLGMNIREVVARFEQERQALAMMDHPGIAKVFDAGATKWGRPFFVMELVRGVPITDYCDTALSATSERLALFIEVCQAIQHAHQKGIIHRDLKPSNILVTGDGATAQPKVIDFGIAKATQGRLTDKTLFTEFDQILGTPLYMSPEQATMSALDVDTRSDIYSLGVLLYELLTGRTPIGADVIDEAGLDELRRVIREVDPPRPSARIRTLTPGELTATAKRRQTQATRLPGLIRGDLDWIVMKCLEKDRNRRYASAHELALDLQRHLDNEAIIARPPSTSYQLGRLIRRHRVVFGAGIAVAASLVVGAIVSTYQAIAKERALRQAIAAEGDTEAFGDFLVRRVLAATRPEEVEGGLGVNVTVAAALEQAVKTLREDFPGRPRAEARARHAIGVTWDSLGRYPEAIDQLTRAIALREDPSVLGPDAPATLETMNDLAVVYLKSGAVEKALPLYDHVLTRRRALFAPDHPHVLTSMNNLAAAYEQSGDLPRARTLYEQTLAASQSTLGADDPYTLKALGNLARVLSALQELDRALPLYELALTRSRQTLGADHPDTITSMNNLALAYEARGFLEQATALHEEAYAKSVDKLGPGHPDTLTSMNNLAACYKKGGQLSKALPLLEDALRLGRSKPGPDHRDTLTTMVNLAAAYEESGERAKALPLYTEALERRRRIAPPDHPETLKLMSNLAVAYAEAGDASKALPLFDETFRLRRSKLGSDHPDTLKSLRNLALGHWMKKDYAEAVNLLESHLRAQQRLLGAQAPEVLALEKDLAQRRIEATQAAAVKTGNVLLP